MVSNARNSLFMLHSTLVVEGDAICFLTEKFFWGLKTQYRHRCMCTHKTTELFSKPKRGKNQQATSKSKWSLYAIKTAKHGGHLIVWYYIISLW